MNNGVMSKYTLIGWGLLLFGLMLYFAFPMKGVPFWVGTLTLAMGSRILLDQKLLSDRVIKIYCVLSVTGYFLFMTFIGTPFPITTVLHKVIWTSVVLMISGLMHLYMPSQNVPVEKG